jgi:hypothetical protein
MVVKDLDTCGTRERHRRRAPVRVHEPQPLTRVFLFNVGIDDALARPSKSIVCVGDSCANHSPFANTDRKKHEAPVGDTNQGFVMENLEGDTTFQCLWKA